MKNALLVSDDLFLSYAYENGNIVKKNNNITSALNQIIEFDNISSNNIDAIKATNYIKEFINGDFGRTWPNLGVLLNCECDILQLDVKDIFY